MNNKLPVSSSRLSYIDILNVLACFSVVVLHANSYFIYYMFEPCKEVRAFFETVFFFAVPVFFMLSGATLMDYRNRYSTWSFFQKRIKRTVIPFLVFSAFFLFYCIYKDAQSYHIQDYRPYMRMFLTGSIPKTHFWFFPELFLVYLFLPFFSILVNSCSQRQLKYLIVLLCLFQSVILPSLQYFLNINITLPIGGYISFVLLGYYIHKYGISTPLLKWLLPGALLALGLRFVVLLSPELHHVFNSYFGPWSFLEAIVVFSLGKRIHLRSQIATIFRKMSKKSLGIYLIHPVILLLLRRLLALDGLSWYYVLIMAPAAYLISYGIVSILQSFRFSKWMVP